MFIITRTIVFIINLIILFYIYFLKKNDCKCSESKKRDFIFYYTISYLIIIINFITFPRYFRDNRILTNILKLYLGIFMIPNVYFLYSYSQELDEKKCYCSDNIGLDIMKIYSVFYIILLIILFLIICSNYIQNADKLPDFNSKKIKCIHIPILRKI